MKLLHPVRLALPALLAAALLPFPSRADAPKTFEVTTLKDIVYHDGKDADPRHKLDLYLPKGKTNFPVVVFVHGGAWMYGSKDILGLYSAVGRFLAENGVGAALPNYRLSPAVKHPEHVRDVARAFAWVRKNVADHGGDPDRLFVGGHSAGGHLAALLATDESYLKAEGLTRAAVRGVLPVSGVYRIPDKLALAMPPLGGAPAPPTKYRLGFNPFDLVFDKDPKAREAASPISHIREGLPPFFVVVADRDLPLLPEMAVDFVKALQAKNVEAELMRVKDRFHSSVMFRATSPDDPVGRAILSFVAKHGS